MKKILITVILLTGIGLIALEVIFRNVVPYALIQPGRFNDNVHPDDLGLLHEIINVVTHDSLILRGYWVTPQHKESKGVIILVHGIGGCKEHFLGVSKKLSERGYESVLLDLRAHGESDGQFTTYGYKERDDIKDIVDYILSKNQDSQVGIWGNSLGGAIALQAMSEDDRISFGIIESTFRDLEEIMIDYQKRVTKISMGYYMKKAMYKSESIADYKVDEVKPIESVTKIHKPVLISHGNKDQRISYKYGEALFENLPGQENEWILVEGGRHNGLSGVGGQEYENRLYQFIEKHTSSIE